MAVAASAVQQQIQADKMRAYVQQPEMHGMESEVLKEV